jgi:hypothetical protein
MNIFIEALVFVLTGYLALTNSLAGFISNVFDLSEPPSETQEVPPDQAEIIHLYSIFDSSFPDILLRSSKYQQAALGAAAGLTGSTTNDPLAALVNIFCTFRTDEYIRTTTGTGFFIDADGVIMTNAHIAQFLLLENTGSFGDTECLVRTGSPAVAKYHAELLYIPPAWVQENANMVDDAVPMGTGERDYALLYVTTRVSGDALPAMFPALGIDTDLLPLSTQDNTVVAAGYPATDLITHGPNTALLAKKASTTVSELYTFGSNYADVFSIRGSVVGAEGASGGPIVNAEGKVIGMIATRGNDEIDGEGSLRAITLSHINRTITEETGFSLAENLNGNLSHRAEIFNETLTPFLIGLLEDGREG